MTTHTKTRRDPLTPERLEYALALANDLDTLGEIVSAALVRDLVHRVRSRAELLEACRMFVALTDDTYSDPRNDTPPEWFAVYDAARAAIAKATT